MYSYLLFKNILLNLFNRCHPCPNSSLGEATGKVIYLNLYSFTVSTKAFA
jgi:hypothetical protein